MEFGHFDDGPDELALLPGSLEVRDNFAPGGADARDATGCSRIVAAEVIEYFQTAVTVEVVGEQLQPQLDDALSYPLVAGEHGVGDRQCLELLNRFLRHPGCGLLVGQTKLQLGNLSLQRAVVTQRFVQLHQLVVASKGLGIEAFERVGLCQLSMQAEQRSRVVGGQMFETELQQLIGALQATVAQAILE